MKKKIIPIALQGIKKQMALLIVFSAIFSYATLQVAVNIRYTIDGILMQNQEILPTWIQKQLTNETMQNLLWMSGTIVILYFMIAIVNYIRRRITTKVKLKINRNIKLALYQHVLNMEYKSYRNFDKTEMLQRITEDSEICADFFEGQFNLILDIVFFSIFVMTESIQLNWMISTYLIVTILGMLVFSVWYMKKLNKSLEKTIEKSKRLLNSTVRSVKQLKLIRMFHKQKEEIEEYQRLNQDYTEENIRMIKLILFYEIVSDHITYLKMPILYMIGGLFVIYGKMTIRTSYHADSIFK